MTHTTIRSFAWNASILSCLLGWSHIAYAQEDASESTEVASEPVTIPALVVEAPVAAEVFVDNEPAGQTPLTLDVPAGKHTVRIAADGFDPFVRRVTVVDGQTTTLKADFIQGGGTVEFQASISPAKLILDDGEMILPIRLNELSEGEHKWEIRATGYETVKGQFSLVKGKNIFIYEALESSRGKVLIESNPSDSIVYLDGENIGMTPIALENVDAGVHSVMIEHKRYAKAFRTMDNTLGNKGIVKASMSKMGAKVNIKTKSKNAEVYIEDHLVGTGKSVRVGLVEKGNYNVRIVSEGHKTLQSDIHIPASGKVKFVANLIPSEDSGMPSLVKKGAAQQINWALWGGVALGTAATTGGTLAILQSLETEPAPSGDAVISLP